MQTQITTGSPVAAAAARRRLLELQRAAVFGDDSAGALDAAILEWRRVERAAWSRDAASERFVRWLLEAAHEESRAVA